MGITNTISTNKSIVTFGTVVSNLVGISFGESGADIDVTNLESEMQEVLAGIPIVECTIEVNGTTPLSQGDVGALSVAWNDGGVDLISSAVVTGVSKGGSLNDKITSSITFKPTPA